MSESCTASSMSGCECPRTARTAATTFGVTARTMLPIASESGPRSRTSAAFVVMNQTMPFAVYGRLADVCRIVRKPGQTRVQGRGTFRPSSRQCNHGAALVGRLADGHAGSHARGSSGESCGGEGHVAGVDGHVPGVFHAL